MVRRSNYRDNLIRALTRLMPEAQSATELLDEAAAERLGINRTDLHCLRTVLQGGGISASKLAEEVGLTRGAMTTALDRLVRAGYVRRFGNPTDGRGVRVEATAAATRAVQHIWEPLRTEGLKLLEQYGDADLEVIRRFVDEYRRLQRVHAERIGRKPSSRTR